MNKESSHFIELRSEVNRLNKEILELKDRELVQSQLIENIVEQRINVAQEAIGRELECPVCTELFIQPVTTSCKHTFCAWCIFRVLKDKSTCPLCSKRVTRVHQLPSLESMVTKFIQHLAPDELAYRKAEQDDRNIKQKHYENDWKKWFPEEVPKVHRKSSSKRGRGRGRGRQ